MKLKIFILLVIGASAGTFAPMIALFETNLGSPCMMHGLAASLLLALSHLENATSIRSVTEAALLFAGGIAGSALWLIIG